MSLTKDYIDNLTDEQILSSAYMCCQRNAVKYAHQTLSEHTADASHICSRAGKREFKERFRQSHSSINYWEYIKKAIFICFISMCVFAVVAYGLLPEGLRDPAVSLFWILWLFIAVFPIIRKIFIEVSIALKYRSLAKEFRSSVEKNLPNAAKYAAELSKMDEYLSKHCVIPQKYWDYALNIVEYIYVDLRADNLKEAINILEDDLHKHRLENRMSEIESLAINNANAIEDMMERINNIECFQEYLANRQDQLEWDIRAKS